MAHPFRAVRIPEGTWDAAEVKAAREGLPLHEVITQLLADWLAGSTELLEWVRSQEGGAAWALRELRCPDCHHIHHTRGCWDMDCKCDRQGQE